MPIEVHCPNPACAKVHVVKNKYAGSRGKCPACGSWMYVPLTGLQPSMAIPRPEGLEQAAAWKSESAPAPARPAARPTMMAPASAAEPEARPAARPAAAPTRKANTVRPDEESEVAEVVDEAAPARRKRRTSWAAPLLLLLAVVGLGAAAAAPFLPGVAAHGTEGWADYILSRRGTMQPSSLDQVYQWLTAATLGGAALLTLFNALASRRPGFFNLVLAYIAVLLCAAFFVVVVAPPGKGKPGMWFQDQLLKKGKIDDTVTATRAAAEAPTGDVSVSYGLQLPVGAGGLAAGVLFLVLATLALHGGWVGRIISLVLLSVLIAVPVVWAFRDDWGIRGHVPELIDTIEGQINSLTSQ